MIPGSPATTQLRHLLTELADAGSTGALRVGGSPGGVLYLVDGRITHAESAGCQDVGDRLVGTGRLSPATWQAAYRAGYADHTVGRHLVQGGHLMQGELVCRVLAAICDATHAILQSDDAPVHFAPGERHWLGLVAQIELATLSRETARRRLLATPTVETPVVKAPVVEAPVVEAPAAAEAAETTESVETAETEEATRATHRELAGAVPGDGVVSGNGPASREVAPPDGPWTSRRATPNVVRIHHGDVQTTNAGPQHEGTNARLEPDYATLKRIRRALTSIG